MKLLLKQRDTSKDYKKKGAKCFAQRSEKSRATPAMNNAPARSLIASVVPYLMLESDTLESSQNMAKS